MIVLPRTDRRGRKRLRPRIEELICIDVHSVVTNKPWAKSLVIDKNGNKIQFVDEMVGDEQRLVIYINGTPQLSFILVDVPITGRIKNPIPWDQKQNLLRAR